MINVKKNLINKEITIPKSSQPLANYNPYTLSNNLVFVSGQIPIIKGEIIYKGKIGHEISIKDGIEASKICILNTFSVLSLALDGNLNQIKKCLKMTVFINSNDNFYDQPKIADGASDLLKTILHPYGEHSRSAVSTNSLPKNASVEIDSIFEINIE